MNKTVKTKTDARAFIDSIPDENRRNDCQALADLMQEITGAGPKMWGEAIIGFGDYHYKYASGREGDWFLTGFSPRKQNITIYLSYGFEQNTDLLKRLGKFKTGKACLYINRLSDIDLNVLKSLVLQAAGTSL